MEKEIGRIKKNDSTDIIIRIDEYKGKKGITIREYVKSEKYTGFSKAGTRIPVDSFLDFRDIINKIDYNELNENSESILQSKIDTEPSNSIKKQKKSKKKKEEESTDTEESIETSKLEIEEKNI
ncbi:MAG: hypothetical protein QXW97_03385 [Candidatus Pacearchaeota archaeon]